MFEVHRAARLYAEIAHMGQLYGDNNDYMFHVDAVVNYVMSFTNDSDVVAAAYLHDVVEDCDVAIEDIEMAFGPSISKMVMLVTDPKASNRKERKKLLYEQFNQEEHSKEKYGAALIKLADRVANHEYSLKTINKNKIKMYYREYNDFIKVFAYDEFLNGPEGNELVQELDNHVKEMQEILKNGEDA